jgi:hypothetical protein
MYFFESPPLILEVILPVEIRYRTFGGHGGGGETRERRTTIAEGATRGRRTMANAQTLGAKPAGAAKKLSACGAS